MRVHINVVYNGAYNYNLDGLDFNDVYTAHSRTLVDVALAWNVIHSLDILFSLNNVFDEDTPTVGHNVSHPFWAVSSEADRRFFLNARWQF